jgi:hypothetical protein
LYERKERLIGTAYHEVTHWFNTLDRQEWLLVLIGAVVVGFLCLQGMGSRKGY